MKEYEIIEMVRKQKGLSISEVCGEEISRSAYQRFAKNETSLSIGKFTYLMEKVHLDYGELKVFNYPEDMDNSRRIMKEIAVAFMRQDIAELKRISTFVKEKNQNPTVKEKHLVSLSDMMVARLSNEKIDAKNSVLYQYLINAMTWTHYELVLFNNSMYVFEPEFVELILSKALFSLSMYQTISEGKSEYFRMLSNAVLYFIQNQNLSLAWKYVEKLGTVQLDSDMYFEKNLQLFLNGIWQVIRGNKDGKSEVQKSLEVCLNLNALDQYQMNLQLLIHLENTMDVDFNLGEMKERMTQPLADEN